MKRIPLPRAGLYAGLALLFGVLAAISPIATPFVWLAAFLLAVLGLIGLRLAGFPRRQKQTRRNAARPRGKKPPARAGRKAPARPRASTGPARKSRPPR
ncbi:MAG: hypothetical protein KGL12_02825 [Rhodospirillales bacterium]|nr:hypothetical protein [Rhodospirillales bacterium]